MTRKDILRLALIGWIRYGMTHEIPFFRITSLSWDHNFIEETQRNKRYNHLIYTQENMTMMLPWTTVCLLLLLVGPITAPAPLVQRKPSRRHASNNILKPNRFLKSVKLLRAKETEETKITKEAKTAKKPAFVNQQNINKVEYDRGMGFQKSIFKTWNAETLEFQLAGNRVEFGFAESVSADSQNKTGTATTQRLTTPPPMMMTTPPPQPATFQLGSLRIMTDSHSPVWNMADDDDDEVYFGAPAPPPPPGTGSQDQSYRDVAAEDEEDDYFWDDDDDDFWDDDDDEFGGISIQFGSGGGSSIRFRSVA